MMNRKLLGKIVTVVISVVIVIILLSRVSIRDVLDTLVSINPLYLLAGFGLYCCTYFLRAFRFSLLLNRSIGIRALFPIICVHNMMTNLLPARTGEISYVYLLKKIHSRTIGEGVATLVVARVFDFIVVIILLFAAGLFIEAVPESFSAFLWIVYLFLFCMVVLLISMIYLGDGFLKFLNTVMTHVKLDRTKFGNFVLRKGDETIVSFKKIELREHGPAIIVVSILIWICSFSCLYVILRGLGIILPAQNVIFGAVLTLLAGILPTPGIAGFGTGQAIWTIIYVPLGMSLDGAIISGFSWHIILIVFTAILGLFGSFELKKQ